MKSVTTVITNSKGEAIGLLCINFDLATPLNEIFKILCDDFEVANVAKATSSDAANCNSNSLSSDETAATDAAAAAAASLTPTAISHLLGGLNGSANNNGTGKGSGDSNNFSVSTEKGGNAGSGTATGNEQTWEGSEYFASDIHDLLNTSVNQTRRQILNDDSIPQRQKNKAIIQELQKQGLFNLRNAVPIISEILNLSRDAIYLHLRACKK